MSTSKGRAGKSSGFESYLKLVEELPLAPVRTERQLDRAMTMIDSLLDREKLEPSEKDYLDVLSDLVERYEEAQHPILPAKDAELLRHLIEAKDVTQLQVARETGIAESTISAVLKGRRLLNRRHIPPLAAYFQVDPAVFAGPLASA